MGPIDADTLHGLSCATGQRITATKIPLLFKAPDHRLPRVDARGPRRSVIGDPWAVQGIFDAAVAGLDDFGGNGADKSVERLGADCVDHPFADSFRIETCRGEAFGQYRFFIGADLRPAQVV